VILAGILVGLAFAIYYSVHYNAYEHMGLELPPDVLAQKSREIVSRLGYEGRPYDSADGLSVNGDFLEWVEKNDKPRPNWDAVLAARPSLLQYWYRQSPDDMFAEGFRDNLLTPGIVTEADPPTVLSGMINLQLDPQGRLTYFQAIPPQKVDTATTPASAPAAGSAFDWNMLFKAADLDLAKFQPAPPAWNSLATADARMAWMGVWPGSNRPLRVEAAAFHGKPVFFSLIGDWTKPDRMKLTEKKSLGEQAQKIIGIFLLFAALGGSIFLAHRNYRRGRGDREGALRLGIVMFLLEMGLFVCLSHFATVWDTIGLSIIAVATALFLGCVMWLLYMALEPWVRRQWPKTIISWTRLLAGNLRDAVVGRDILLGVALGVVWILVFQIRYIPIMHMGAAPGIGSTDALMGGRLALGVWLRQWPSSIQTTLVFFLVLLGLKVLLRREWIAAIAFVVIFAVPRGLSSSYMKIELPAQIIVYGIALLLVLRFGLLPLAVAIFTINMLSNVPFSADFSTWYMPASILALLSVLVLVGWGFYHSLGGQPLWNFDLD
jgi:serine/threonine-protein kinase